ncbi:hypothetical protein DYB37_011672 [Aphanomyces astaci]|uniref:Uncharacterized protein n=1 Tax=Aphanomyces astaci TaxID=112090 RepID=A0A3R6Y148_APHAT|nr:hypothetical protein DYB35_012127 [Aphanomyces astaci]RHZ29441.1 hypothetical protein DYB37_011672 [Aphanomyces astaci]
MRIIDLIAAPVHRFQECVRKLFEAGDMTPEADRIVEFLYLLLSSFEAKVDSILERIAKQDSEYCSLISVIKSVEIAADRIAHMSKTKASASKVRGTDEAYTAVMVPEAIKLNADGTNYPEWSDHVEQKICQQKLRKYLTSSTRFQGYDEDDDYVAKSYINLSIHRDNLKYIKETDLEKAFPSIVHTNLA